MRLLLAGCEYSGTSTVAHAIDDWMSENMGTRFSLIHEHWKIPHTSGHPDNTTSEEQEWLLAATPKFKEMHQRHSLYYHTQASTYNTGDGMVVGGHIDDAVYAPLYFEYGQKGYNFDRELVMHQVEKTILYFTNDTVVVHITADSDVIKQRMKDDPHENGIVQPDDVDKIKTRFEELVNWSLLGHKISIDNSGALVDTMAQFLDKIEPHLTDSDRSRILAHKVLSGG
ncbi:MAG TPA: hypothetical protein EYQ82_10130 [Dehalococcoidia bacterium]|jgi:hypothetical protein|nr:hypothetical protein [Dehalococcoidia bacterium]